MIDGLETLRKAYARLAGRQTGGSLPQPALFAGSVNPSDLQAVLGLPDANLAPIMDNDKTSPTFTKFKFVAGASVWGVDPV